MAAKAVGRQLASRPDWCLQRIGLRGFFPLWGPAASFATRAMGSTEVTSTELSDTSVALDRTRQIRPLPGVYWFLCAAALIGAVVGLITGWAETETMLLILILAIPVGLVTRSLPIAADARWLPTVVILGYWAKLGASIFRYWALEVLYHGVGDASGYHNHGITLAPVWRSLQVPEFEAGTEFVQAFTGFVYVPHVPTMLGGFFMFATMAFFGQVLMYAAFRRVSSAPRLKWYAALIFFFPNILYWPSSIGKESLMTLFIGITAYGAARLFSSYHVRWMALIGLGLVGCAAIRSHIALLLAVSLALAMIFGRAPQTDHARVRRMALLATVLVVLVVVVRFASVDLNVDLSGGVNQALLEEEIDPLFAGVEEQTSRGGSAVEGGSINSLLDIPDALLRVVIRPLPYDAGNAQALANSLLEGTLLLGLLIWRMPAMLRNFLRMWRSPYITFSLAYTAGFIFGHSGILNLGIIARQRSQLIPFLMVLLVELGAKVKKKGEGAPSGTVAPGRPVLTSVGPE